MNLGLISLAKNDYNKAAQEFGNAAGIDELKEATGVLYLKKGANIRKLLKHSAIQRATMLLLHRS